MSVTVSFDDVKEVFNNTTTNLSEKIENLKKGFLNSKILKITIMNDMDFHYYEFEHLSDKTYKAWVLNNLMWALTCDETKENMNGIFDDLMFKLRVENHNNNLI
jgi:hypothetical protein